MDVFITLYVVALSVITAFDFVADIFRAADRG